MIVTQEQLSALMGFRSGGQLVSSLYLNTDPRHVTRKEIEILFKNLVAERREELGRLQAEGGTARNGLKGVDKDLDRIGDFLDRHLQVLKHLGVAVFSCAAHDFFQVYHLPRSPRNRLVVDSTPYIRPLSVTLDHYRRLCIVLTDRSSARVFEFYMGELREHEPIEDHTPSKARVGGWKGYEEKNIFRHSENKALEHFKHTAAEVFRLYQATRFEGLIIGAKSEYCAEFERCLHSYLRERIVGRLELEIDAPARTIAEAVIPLEVDARKREQAEMVKALVQETRTQGLGTMGVDRTLHALNQGAVRTLLLTREFAQPGSFCQTCGFLNTRQKQCPNCDRACDRVPDVGDLAVEMALLQGSEVHHLEAGTALDDDGKIGALLRYKV